MNQATLQQNNNITAKINGILDRYPVILQFLKFAAIGFMTTAVDFLLLNLIAKFYGINTGLRLGGINILAFALALLHSYIWNRNWAFSQGEAVAHVKVFFRSVIAGTLGVLGIGFAVLGGKNQAMPFYYITILSILLFVEIIIWHSFDLSWFKDSENKGYGVVLGFVIVSIFGALINSGIVALLTEYWKVTSNLDLNVNIAKVFATAVSLFWNFIGYKLAVFKK